METSDHELLRLFVKNRSEDAFRQMVDRHLNLVFATARRIVGDPQLAEEIAQGVFVLLVRKAAEIKSDQPLAGWLYHTTRHHALNASRAEGRRRQREQTAAAMQPNQAEPAPELIAAELEQAMDELSVDDRDALVLRFLDNRQLRDVGTELGISEEAARKRVNRALEKLRGIFGKRGIALSTGLLATALAGEAVTAAPVALGSAITATALSQLAGLSTTTTAIAATQGAMNTMNLLNLKTVATILGAAALTGTSTYLIKEHEADKLRADYQSLMGAQAELVKDRQDAAAAIRLRDEQIEQLKKDVADLPRLRGEVTRLRSRSARLAEIESSVTNSANEPFDEALNNWLSRVDKLKKSMERNEELWIPEMRFLKNSDWLAAVQNADVDTDIGARKALNSLRLIAKNSFGPILLTALDKFTKATGKTFPSSIAQLAPYFDTPIDSAILLRYMIVPSSEVTNTGLVRSGMPPWVITEKEPVDLDYDARLVVSAGGFGTTDFGADAMIPLINAYRAAHSQSEPFTEFRQLIPYVTTPQQQHWLDQAIARQAAREKR